MKKFYESLWEHTMEIINLEKNKINKVNKRAADIMSKCKKLLYL